MHTSLQANELCSPRPSLLWKGKGDLQIIIKKIYNGRLTSSGGTAGSFNFLIKLALNCPSFRKQSGVSGQVWWPILRICALYLTHSKCAHTSVNTDTPWTHTQNSGQPFMLRRPGSSWGFDALLKGLTSVVVLRMEKALVINYKIKMAWKLRPFRLLGDLKKECTFTIVGWLCPHIYMQKKIFCIQCIL